MRILVAADALNVVGGVESYALTVAEQLERLGHEVWLWAQEQGDAADRARDLGLRVLEPDQTLPESPDAVLAQDAVATLAVAESYPGAPQVFVAHSDLYDKFLPPQLPGLIAAVIAMYDRVEQRIRALAVPTELVRLAQPIDTVRFRSLRPLPDRPAKALALGHYHHGERLERLRRACSEAGVELSHVGIHGYSDSRPVELVYNEADIVFGKARVIHEAMACGRAVYVYDHNGGDGWVTSERYAALAADNFGGQSSDTMIDAGRLAADLDAYQPDMGLINRDLAVRHHSATRHAAAIVELLNRLAPHEHPLDAPLDELARATRVMHRSYAWAVLHESELARLAAAEQHEKAVATGLARRADELAERLDAADERAAAAEERARAAETALAKVSGTRRWRFLQGALRPLDRIRAPKRASRETERPG